MNKSASSTNTKSFLSKSKSRLLWNAVLISVVEIPRHFWNTSSSRLLNWGLAVTMCTVACDLVSLASKAIVAMIKDLPTPPGSRQMGFLI